VLIENNQFQEVQTIRISSSKAWCHTNSLGIRIFSANLLYYLNRDRQARPARLLLQHPRVAKRGRPFYLAQWAAGCWGPIVEPTHFASPPPVFPTPTRGVGTLHGEPESDCNHRTGLTWRWSEQLSKQNWDGAGLMAESLSNPVVQGGFIQVEHGPAARTAAAWATPPPMCSPTASSHAKTFTVTYSDKFRWFEYNRKLAAGNLLGGPGPGTFSQTAKAFLRHISGNQNKWSNPVTATYQITASQITPGTRRSDGKNLRHNVAKKTDK